jgi:hypothetical protein
MGEITNDRDAKNRRDLLNTNPWAVIAETKLGAENALMNIFGN